MAGHFSAGRIQSEKMRFYSLLARQMIWDQYERKFGTALE
jgi:hypothetical protein